MIVTFQSFIYAGGPAFVCCLIISFAPYFFYSKSWNDANNSDPIKSALKSRSFGYSLVAGIAATIPPLIELLVAALNSKEKSKKRSIFMLSLLICLIVPEFISLFNIATILSSKLYICNWSARLILSLFSASNFLCQFSQGFWRNKWFTFSVTLVYIGIALIPLSPYFKTSYQPLFQNFGSLIQIMGCTIFFFLSYSFLRRCPKKNGTDEHMTTDDFFCRIDTICIIFVMLIILSLHGAYKFPYWKDCTGDYLTIYTFILAAPNIAISVAFAHISRNEAYFLQKVKQMFVRYISHEMRTPLNTAVMGLQYLRSELVKSCRDTELLGIVDEVRGACDISVTILNEMLDYDKLQSGGMKLELEEVAVKEFLEVTVSPFYVQACQKQIQLECNLSNPQLLLLSIHSDRNKLAQVIRNLLSNALKFTPSGGSVQLIPSVQKLDHSKLNNNKKISPTSSAIFCTHTLRIDVIDSGAGVSKENQKRLFKEIVQFNPGKLQSGGGSGLGLYISKGIMDLHEGSGLTITSEGEGRGCTFTATLPAKYKEDDISYSIPILRPTDARSDSLFHWLRGLRSIFFSVLNNRGGKGVRRSSHINDNCNILAVNVEPGRDRDQPASLFLPTFDNSALDRSAILTRQPSYHRDYISAAEATMIPLHKVLVVDDSTSNRKMLVRLLRDRCKLIHQAEDGEDAVRQVQAALESGLPEDIFDVVFMDFVMPNMSGPEAAKCMRDLGYAGPIIGITGNVLIADRDLYVSQGANTVLTKPVDIRDIEHALCKLIRSDSVQEDV